MRYLPLLLVAITGGCGEPQTEVVSLPAPHLMVIDLDGEKRSIPATSLYDPETGKPSVASVLVVDRQSNRQVFVELDRLPATSQADARYILVTKPPIGASRSYTSEGSPCRDEH